MPAELVVAPEAEFDIAEAYAWYEGRRVGSGIEPMKKIARSLHQYRELILNSGVVEGLNNKAKVTMVNPTFPHLPLPRTCARSLTCKLPEPESTHEFMA